LLTSTFLTLVLLPVLYEWVEKVKAKSGLKIILNNFDENSFFCAAVEG